MPAGGTGSGGTFFGGDLPGDATPGRRAAVPEFRPTAAARNRAAPIAVAREVWHSKGGHLEDAPRRHA
ncbi:hypothetical protein NGM37_56775, partial [Streptomyces sp. TRM76130]|nr:hypothetical protein [Streptomyces sp. TRM76130]